MNEVSDGIYCVGSGLWESREGGLRMKLITAVDAVDEHLCIDLEQTFLSSKTIHHRSYYSVIRIWMDSRLEPV
ncbi:hypothetical protein AMECASPLE_013471 [Ameca splendens]|uniref:Uncharacterized protein n=1 Tax=Ameca splendens TaxID=208324 RepID=A0ABV0Y1T3_9TELE